MYIEEVVAQQAVELTGFGKFNIKAGIVGALIYLNCAFCITSVGFIIPTAACDFKMSTIEKGHLNAAPMMGMVLGSTVWWYMADLKGRKTTILIALAMQFLADMIASFVPNYTTLLLLKLLSGIGFTGQLSVIFPYVGEFQPTSYRHQVLSCMEFFWAIGIIAVSLLAWLLIPMRLEYTAFSAFSSSWRFFVLMSALPGLFTAIWLLTMPDTPKYLAETGQSHKLLKVLTRMFVENTGKTDKQFWEQLATSQNASISQLVSTTVMAPSQEIPKVKPSALKKERLKELLNNSKIQARALLRKPFTKRLCVTSLSMFFMTSTYYSLMTWFPELFQRFATYEVAFPNESASVCSISAKLSAAAANLNETFNSLIDPFGCDSEIDVSVYVNSIWLGASCFPGAILLPLTVSRVGYKTYLMLTSSISCAVTLGFFFVETSTQNLILSCIFEALTSLGISVIFCLLVELFPTNLRVMATAITLFIARFGSLFGNMLFGYLIDSYCTLLILLMAGQLF
ncbi:hypothetical protein QAD02_010019, partial [Eretmocerus hayati]